MTSQLQALRGACRGMGPIRRRRAMGLGVGALSILLYASALGHPLIWDSKVLVSDPAVHSLANVPVFFTHSSTPPLETGTRQLSVLPYYRPLAKTLLALEYAAFGETSAGYHLVSILLNALVVTLFFAVVAEITGREDVAVLAALLVAVNPARAEAVYWVYSTSTLLMAGCGMGMLLLHHRGRRSWAVCAFVASLLSREAAIFWVPILVAYEAWVHPSASWRARARALVPYLMATVGFLALRRAVVGGLPPLVSEHPITVMNTWAVIVARFLKIALWPDAPVPHYLRQTFPDLTLRVMASYLVSVAGLAGVVLLWRRQRSLCLWPVWFVSWIALAFNLGGAGHYLMAEKQLYLASGGLAVLAAFGLTRVRWGPLVAGVVIGVHAVVILQRAAYWSDEVRHLQEVVRFAPDHILARAALGTELRKRGDLEGAARQFESIVALEPEHSAAHNDLGSCYYHLGKLDAAAAAWRRASATDPTNPMPAFNLAMLAERRGADRDALRHYRTYLRLADPAPPWLHEKVRALEKRLGPGPSPGSAPE